MISRVVSRLEGAPDRHPNLLRVLTYHRVDWPDASAHLYPGTLSATPDEFDWQMEHLANRYHPVDVHEVLSAVRRERELPPRSVLITFDDAYRDFSVHAWPTLRKWSVPALLFVPTAYPADREIAFWWDRLHQAARAAGLLETAVDRRRVRAIFRRVKALPHPDAMALVDDFCRAHEAGAAGNDVLSWEELRQLADEGLDLAGHTCTHPLMTRLAVDRAIQEATNSRDDLRSQLGTDLPVLAYPDGACSQELARSLQDAGFEMAFTTQRGLNDLRTAAPLLLRRINVSSSTARTLWRAQLLAEMRHLSAVWRR